MSRGLNPRKRKGFLLSLDAVIAIGLILSMTVFIAGISTTYYSPELRYQRLYYTGKDVMLLLENAQLGQLESFDTVKYYQDTGVLVEEDKEKTILDIIGSLWSSGNSTMQGYAANITADILNSTLPESHSYQVVMGGDEIYRRGGLESTYLARLSSIVSGVEIGKPIDGYFARAYPSMVGDFRSVFIYLGGYVGQGNITVIAELPDFDDIVSMDMELDSGRDFDMYINGSYSGSYAKQTNDTMRSSSWSVSSSYFSNLGEGTNYLSLEFPSKGSYFGGGYIKIIYNTTNLTAVDAEKFGDNASSMFMLPGIDGIVNLYSSIYVPGYLTSMDAHLHYSSVVPVTKYLGFGNITIFEDNRTGEIVYDISNQSITGNLSDYGLDLSYLDGRTVPMRFGLKNVTYILGEAGAADVVMITDRTGSMTSCDVDVSCRPGLCDSYDPCHDRRSNVAVKSDQDFINTILGAEGKNYVGLIGYGQRHGGTCSFHDITADNTSLQQRIDDYNYGGSWQDCGWTCTSCGVVGATELLQEKDVLYNLTVRSDKDDTEYSLSSNSRTVTLTINGLNKSRFIKSRFSLMARNVDVESGYQDCVFLNGNYLGRVCESNSGGVNGWHSCSYVVEKDWLQEGDNSVLVTAGGSGGCLSGGGENWMFKDSKLMVWEYRNNESVVSANSSLDEIAINSVLVSQYLELPEENSDYPNPVDFTTGLNTSGNTFGLGSVEDGWDWQSGTYGYSGTCDFNGATGGELELYTRQNSESKSCSYGVEFNVTPDVYSMIQSGAQVGVEFYYEWDKEGFWWYWETSDEVWVKARIAGPSGTACEDPDDCYLGSDMDSGHNNGDSTYEVYAEDDPDSDFSGTFFQDITSWIDSAGTYYLDLGGKILNNDNNERGYFRFDDISVSIYTQSDPWVSFSFPDVNMSFVKAATLEFQARDIDPDYYDCVYMNGYHIGMADYQEYNESGEWEEVRFDVNPMYLAEGGNVIEFSGGTQGGCNRTGDVDVWDVRNISLSLVHSNESTPYDRRKSMLIMSDGEANTLIGDCSNYGSSGCPSMAGWLTPANETIARACEAHDKYNISIYAIAFGDAGQDAIDMLYEAACCDNCTNFFTSNNEDDLREIYSRIAQGIINSSWVNQTLETSQDVGEISTLYPDSFIRIEYSSFIEPPEYGEITFDFETSRFEDMSGNSTVTDNATMSKEGWFFVPENVEVIGAKVTSYSSQFWTDRLYILNETGTGWERVYWLGDFTEYNYSGLGDPFIVDMPVRTIGIGNNSVRIGTGYGIENGTGGSPDSRVIYTGRLPAISVEGYSDVFPRAEGSTMTVYYDIDGDNVSDGSVVVQIGPNPSDMFDPMNDSIDNAFMRLLDSLNVIWDSNPGAIGSGGADPYDGSNENPIDFMISSQINIDSTLISDVPSLWGPVSMEVRIWN